MDLIKFELFSSEINCKKIHLPDIVWHFRFVQMFQHRPRTMIDAIDCVAGKFEMPTNVTVDECTTTDR